MITVVFRKVSRPIREITKSMSPLPTMVATQRVHTSIATRYARVFFTHFTFFLVQQNRGIRSQMEHQNPPASPFGLPRTVFDLIHFAHVASLHILGVIPFRLLACEPSFQFPICSPNSSVLQIPGYRGNAAGSWGQWTLAHITSHRAISSPRWLSKFGHEWYYPWKFLYEYKVWRTSALGSLSPGRWVTLDENCSISLIHLASCPFRWVRLKRWVSDSLCVKFKVFPFEVTLETLQCYDHCQCFFFRCSVFSMVLRESVRIVENDLASGWEALEHVSGRVQPLLYSM